MLDIIASIIPEKSDILQCKVINENPLKLQVVNTPKMQIDTDRIILTRNVTNHVIKTDLVNEDLTIKNALKLNEIVLVMTINDNQKFIVIDRVVT